MVAFVCGRFGGIQQTPGSASARCPEHVATDCGCGLAVSTYALIAAISGARASTTTPPVELPRNRRAAKYDPITSAAAKNCATSVSTVGKTANQSPIQPGICIS